MSPSIFVTGISGYIGGHVVEVMAKKHPEWNIVALVRNQQQSDTVKKMLPKVETVIGDLVRVLIPLIFTPLDEEASKH